MTNAKVNELVERARGALKIERTADNVRAMRNGARLRLDIVRYMRQEANGFTGAERDRLLDVAKTLEVAR